MNYSRQEFFDSTFKEIVDMIEELNAINNKSVEEQPTQRILSIDEVPFL